MGSQALAIVGCELQSDFKRIVAVLEELAVDAPAEFLRAFQGLGAAPPPDPV